MLTMIMGLCRYEEDYEDADEDNVFNNEPTPKV